MNIKGIKLGPLFVIFLMLMSLASCEKEETAPDSSKAATTPSIKGSVGAMWAIRTVTKVNTGGINMGYDVTIDVGTGMGVFFDGDKMVDVGTVSLNSVPLTKYSNNSYISTVSMTEPTGVDFSNGIKWSITGGSGFAAFTHTVTNSFPSTGSFNCEETLTRDNGYTVAFSSVSGADSILFAVNDVVKTVAGNKKSYTFTAAELSKLSKGSGVVMAVPYNYKLVTYGGKVIAFGSEVAYTKTITIN